MDAKQRVALLERAMAKVCRISPHYNNVLREVSARINASGSLDKGDIATLAFWKRIRTDSWAEDFLILTEAEVRAVSGQAVVAARELDLIAAASKARELLRKLPGFGRGSAMSSAVLTAIRPSDLAVYDRNANISSADVGWGSWIIQVISYCPSEKVQDSLASAGGSDVWLSFQLRRPILIRGVRHPPRPALAVGLGEPFREPSVADTERRRATRPDNSSS